MATNPKLSRPGKKTSDSSKNSGKKTTSGNLSSLSSLSSLKELNKPKEKKPKQATAEPARISEAAVQKMAKELGVGEYTLKDILEELEKPGRDPRTQAAAPILRSDVLEIKDLKPGMELKGTVRNIVDFGAFVDIGVHQDGLVHISQLADRFVKHPLDVVKVGDIVDVRVLDVDVKREKISLTMRKEKQSKPSNKRN